ncbi:hypothetical protein [Microbacterium sp. H1-D42]|uniref:hypothetical protein n=1 Tax=Microbacterium sp. H1-D42 TaxID=2925844 RepID=UPI001F532BC6|nr:hypothetical protein [Microbacterium sp. H1-D42]UNK69402.1 hypothetical protein MNR00_09395 [Microbacterium sp. H1-D42]
MHSIPELEDLVRRVRAAILSIDAEPSRNRKTIFPAMWCEYASIVIAEILERDHSTSWTFIDAGLPEAPNGHAWLELRDDDGTRLLTIDATLDQFPWSGDGPHVGTEQTPAAQVFTTRRYEGPWEGWGVLAFDPTFRKYAEDFAAQSGL